MRKNLLLFAGSFVLSLCGLAQSSLVVFSEDGDAFYAYVNGVRQNDKPETYVKVTGFTANAASMRVEFADKTLPQLKQNMVVEPGFEYAIRVKRDMKKQLKLGFFAKTPISNNPLADPVNVPYHTVENNYNGPVEPDNATIITNTVPVTNTISKATMSVNMPGTGASMVVTGVDPNSMNGINTTTVINSSSTSSYVDNNGASYNSSSYTTTSKTGCSAAMGADNFAKMKQAIESKPFSDTKMSTAKVATKNACLSASQVKAICKLFNMDDEKLVYAKYAYDYCVDKANYYQVSEVFAFSSTTDELNTFLEQ